MYFKSFFDAASSAAPLTVEKVDWIYEDIFLYLYNFRGAELYIQQALDWESKNDFARAVECYVRVTPSITKDVTVLERCYKQVSIFVIRFSLI